MIILMYKWRKKTRFVTVSSPFVLRLLSLAGLDKHSSFPINKKKKRVLLSTRTHRATTSTCVRRLRRDLERSEKTGLFVSFPYVCPEPVLVKSPFLV